MRANVSFYARGYHILNGLLRTKALTNIARAKLNSRCVQQSNATIGLLGKLLGANSVLLQPVSNRWRQAINIVALREWSLNNGKVGKC